MWLLFQMNMKLFQIFVWEVRILKPNTNYQWSKNVLQLVTPFNRTTTAVLSSTTYFMLLWETRHRRRRWAADVCGLRGINAIIAATEIVTCTHTTHMHGLWLELWSSDWSWSVWIVWNKEASKTAANAAIPPGSSTHGLVRQCNT